MTTISFARHQFPPDIIRCGSTFASPSPFRDVEDLLAERGLEVSYETIRRWVFKFGPLFAKELRRRRHRPTPRWHLDEMAVLIGDRRFWLWRAVDDEGEVLDLLVQRRRDARAAARLMRKLLKRQGFAPETLITDKLRSYGAARTQLGLSARHEQGLRKNNRAENSHLPVRRRSASNRPGRRSGSCPLTPSSTTRSTFSAILFPANTLTGAPVEADVRISMDGRGRWMDNVFIERLWRSLKYEGVYLKGYADGREAKAGMSPRSAREVLRQQKADNQCDF
jgi:transposase-like protein